MADWSDREARRAVELARITPSAELSDLGERLASRLRRRMWCDIGLGILLGIAIARLAIAAI